MWKCVFLCEAGREVTGPQEEKAHFWQQTLHGSKLRPNKSLVLSRCVLVRRRCDNNVTQTRTQWGLRGWSPTSDISQFLKRVSQHIHTETYQWVQRTLGSEVKARSALALVMCWRFKQDDSQREIKQPSQWIKLKSKSESTYNLPKNHKISHTHTHTCSHQIVVNQISTSRCRCEHGLIPD